jgi:hypothetical protein
VGTGTLSDALAWLEYCNGTGDTQYVLQVTALTAVGQICAVPTLDDTSRTMLNTGA